MYSLNMEIVTHANLNLNHHLSYKNNINEYATNVYDLIFRLLC